MVARGPFWLVDVFYLACKTLLRYGNLTYKAVFLIFFKSEDLAAVGLTSSMPVTDCW